MIAERNHDAIRLAARFNNLMFGLFGAWLALVLMFWLRAWGPLLPFDEAPLQASAPIWFAVSVAAAAIAAKLPRRYYLPRRAEIDGGIYRSMGVPQFRAMITDGDFINAFVRRRHPGYRVHRGSDALASLVARGMQSERSHHALLWFGLGTSICAAVGGWHGWAALIGLGNLVGNFYPVILQRYTRGRVWRVRPMAVRQALGVDIG